MDTATAALISAGAATLGWLYAARRARALSRMQHTVSVMLQASFNSEFQIMYKQMRIHIRQQTIPHPINGDQDTVDAIRRVLNHYEFIAAGIRNGDFNEILVMDSERSTIINMFEGCKEYIWALRNDRHRMAIYEHLEWLCARWCNQSPRRIKAFVEWVRQRPFQGMKHNHRKTVAN
jgi:hypothetical protein